MRTDKNSQNKKLDTYFINIDTKILNKTLTDKIQQYIKKVTYYNQVNFILRIQGTFDT